MVFKHLMVSIYGMESLVSWEQFQKELEKEQFLRAEKNTPKSPRDSTIFASKAINLLSKRTRGKVQQVKH